MAGSAVEAAKARRAGSAQASSIKTQWFVEEVSSKVRLTVQQRVKLATNFLRDRVVINLSKPVRKYTSQRGRVAVDPRSRSRPGEFPRADTTLLMKSIFAEVKDNGDGTYDGFVGTPIDYGLTLELKMDRSFLVRTLREESGNIKKIVTGPIK